MLLKVDAIQRGQTLLSSVQWTAALSSESAFPPQATLLERGRGGQADATIGFVAFPVRQDSGMFSNAPPFSPTVSVQHHPIRLLH